MLRELAVNSARRRAIVAAPAWEILGRQLCGITLFGGTVGPIPPDETLLVIRRVWIEVLRSEIQSDALARGIAVPPLGDKRRIVAAYNRIQGDG